MANLTNEMKTLLPWIVVIFVTVACNEASHQTNAGCEAFSRMYMAEKQHALFGHMFQTQLDTTPVQSASLCSKDNTCVSFNHDGTNGICQLNNARKEDFPQSYTTSSRYSYYFSLKQSIVETTTESVQTSQSSTTRPTTTGSEEECTGSEPLGMESGAILDSQITATDVLNNDYENYGPAKARFNSNGACCSSRIQVDLGHTVALYGLIVQGRYGHTRNYVAHFKISYSDDGETWTYVKKEDGSHRLFFSSHSNTEDVSVPVESTSHDIIYLRFLRIQPSGWVGEKCMRFELIGCNVVTLL